MINWTGTTYLTPKHPRQPSAKPLGRHPQFLHRILTQVYIHRFLTAEQLFNLHDGGIRSERQAREYLRRLRSAGLTEVLPSRVPTNQPLHVHYVTRDGVSLLNHLALKHGINPTARFENIAGGNRSVETSGHDRLITDLQIGFETDPTIKMLTMAVNERRYKRDDKQLTFTVNNKPQAIEPDLGMLFYGQKRYPIHFIELDNGSKAIPVLVDQILAYHTWWDSDEGQAYLTTLYQTHGYTNPSVYIRLLVVLHDHVSEDPTDQDFRLEDLLTHVTEFPEALRRQLWLVEAHRLKRADLTEPLWICPSELAWLPEYEAFRKKLPAGDNNRLQRHREELNFIRKKLANQPRLPLLQKAANGQTEAQAQTAPNHA